MIFLDTSAIYALADKADPNHANAYKKFDIALASEEIFLLHNYVLVECCLIAGKAGTSICASLPKGGQGIQYGVGGPGITPGSSKGTREDWKEGDQFG